MNTGFLEYGALGLLAVVLLSIGLTARELLKREVDKAEKREAVVEERRSMQDAFMHQLRIEDREERKAFSDSLTTLVAQGTEADLRVVAQLEELSKMQCTHEEETAERTKEWQKGIVGILGALERLAERKKRDNGPHDRAAPT